MYRPRLVIMLKEPRPGRVKTRLGRDIGMVEAAWWFRHQCARLLRRVEDPRWDTLLAVTPDREGLASRIWPGHLPRLPQGAGDLGVRMLRLFRTVPPGPVLIVGADIPGVDRRHIARAFAALGRADAVIGPAPDGGYWLIGLRRSAPPPSGLFDNVRWSSAHARADTLRNLHGVRTVFVDELADVDRIEDLRPAGADRPAAHG